jgi:hypothetical protein
MMVGDVLTDAEFQVAWTKLIAETKDFDACVSARADELVAAHHAREVQIATIRREAYEVGERAVRLYLADLDSRNLA